MKNVINQRPPLKWAGSKYNIMPQLRAHLPRAKCLVEPFVGGGSVFMNTDYDNYILCDSNPALINFYLHLTYNTKALIDRAWKLFLDSSTADDYNRNRQKFNEISRSHRHPLEWAALFLYLNRHSFNGLYRTNLKDEFNVPFGKRRLPYFPFMEMRLFAEKAKDTHTRFICADFRTSINALINVTPSDDVVIYCDPPYLPLNEKDSFTHYNGKAFTEDDHRELVRLLLEANRLYDANVVISNSDTETTHEIYAPFKRHRLSARRSIAASGKAHQKAKEVIGVLEGRKTASTVREQADVAQQEIMSC